MLRIPLLVLAVLAAGPVPSQTPTPEITRDLRGVIDGTRGKPARVTIYRNDMERSAVDPLCDGQTAADGSFAFKAVPWLQGYDWGSNTMIAVARAGDRAGFLEIRGDAVALDKLVVKLLDTVNLKGQVRGSDDGEPIAGAFVWPSIFGEVAADARPEVWVTAPLLPWRVATDADGRFVLKGLPPIAPVHLRVEHEDYALAWHKVYDLSRPYTAELERAGRISGVVTMPDGKPAVRVTVMTTGRGTGYGRTITDENGKFTLTGLAEGVYEVWAEALDLTVIAVADLAVTPGEHIEGQKIRFVKGGFIVGRILDAATGKPVQPGTRADVAMYGPARPRGGACECTPVLADGTFKIRAPAGTNHIYLRSPGWSEPQEDVEVVEGRETEVVWRVQKHGPK